MKSLRSTALFRALRDRYYRMRWGSKSVEEVFTEIYDREEWQGSASRSGPGSGLEQTRTLTSSLPALLRRYEIRTMLDLPCGDFHWMKDVDLGDVDYTGADIVHGLVQHNTERFGSPSRRFTCINLLEDDLPAVDLIFCRDCLVHLTRADIFRALANVARSGSCFLLTTTFTDPRSNEEIVTGQWRPINLQADPFFLPEPEAVIYEGCGEVDGAFGDKALALWKVGDLQQFLPSTSPLR